MGRSNRGIHELYGEDPQRADRLLWGRRADPLSRRGFLRGSGLLAISAAVGATIPYARFMPGGLIPAALAQADGDFAIAGKEGLIVLNDRPLNAETPAHLLDEDLTPARYLFVRNNGIPPPAEPIDPREWRLEIGGESALRRIEFSIAELQQRFEHHSYALQLECAGNGRREFFPTASGNQWSVGAVGCPRWTGVRLRDVLGAAGMRDDAVYVAYSGADLHASGAAGREAISRGVPIAKALEDESLIAWAMNDAQIPHLNGYPLRLVCGGWPGSVSGKWLRRLLVRDRVHDGEKMTGDAYRLPCRPVAPGSKVPDEQMCIIESMPVKSLITRPRSGIAQAHGEPLSVRGHAWAGDLSVEAVHLSIDFGQSWRPARLKPAVNRLAWQRWQDELRFPQRGYYEIWARARDSAGRSQPMVVPGWNPKGYLNNACHRIAVQVV